MTNRSRGGFTIVEVLIAIIMLSVGVLALASSSGTITRMMDDGRSRTDLAAVAQSVLDSLRTQAYSAGYPTCTALSSGTMASPPRRGMTVAWRVSGAPATQLNLRVLVAYRSGRGMRSDSVSTSLFCR
jgi:prepilin-type N-terminal cleavage/methylation domain-containing protein